MSLTEQERKYAGVILRYFNDVLKAKDTRDFLSRIVEEEQEIDPNSWYRCDTCGYLKKGVEVKLLHNGMLICRDRCKEFKISEMIYGEKKEGE